MATIEEKIEVLLTDKKYKGDEQTEIALAKIVGSKCRCYDSDIDDGVDDRKSKDKYVLYSAFDFEDSPIEVKVFYGDVTKKIGYVEVRNADEDE